MNELHCICSTYCVVTHLQMYSAINLNYQSSAYSFRNELQSFWKSAFKNPYYPNTTAFCGSDYTKYSTSSVHPHSNKNTRNLFLKKGHDHPTPTPPPPQVYHRTAQGI